MVNQIENLPNELFAEIMRYLTAVDAIYAFVKLNKRFERLTFRFCRFINLESVDKTKIDFIFQNHDSNQWLSLRISDNNEISSSLNYIFENESIVNRFSQLQSLSLLRMETLFEKNISIYLRNLISLEINPVCGQNLINLYLPQLKTLTLSSCRHTNWIKALSQIESIEYTIRSCCLAEEKFNWPSKLKRLKVIFSHDDDRQLIQDSLRNLSELITLEIYQQILGRTVPDGEVWQQIIRSSLPSLKNFQFYFYFFWYDRPSLNGACKSFNTSFYTSENNWLSGCQLYRRLTCARLRSRNYATIYSIPCSWKPLNTIPNSQNSIIRHN